MIAVVAPAPAAPAAKAAPAPSAALPDFQALSQQAMDPAQAMTAVKTLRSFLAGKPDSMYVPYSRLMLVQALLTAKAPASELLPAIDEAEKILPDRPQAKVSFYAMIARSLSERGIALDRASAYAAKALSLCPNTEEARGMKSFCLGVQGEVQLAAGKTDLAIASLLKALPDSPDSQSVLTLLGGAYEKSGKSDKAIDAYLRSAATFPGNDSTALAPLRSLWRKQHGSLAGLDQRLEALRRASIQHVAIESHKVPNPKPAPAWRLPDLDEKIHDLASYKGRVLVMDFWGSWCGPCRMELPLIEALYQRYKSNPKVAIVGINWERAEGAGEHRSLAREFVMQNNLTFPMMYDHERNAVEPYQIQAFPTVIMIDREGVVRYVNIGFDPHADQILDAQIRSLLD
jgi:thiol-disulfide isomerase/thioredoxin